MRMKMGNKILWLMSCLLFCGQVVWGEKLTLQEAIQLAQASSPEAEAARHTYRAAYWSYRSFRADYLPEVSLSASPYLNRQINKVTQPDGTELFLRQNQLATDLTLSVSQNVWFTGGNLFMQTAAQRMDELGEKSTAYNTQPFTVGYNDASFSEYECLCMCKGIDVRKLSGDVYESGAVLFQTIVSRSIFGILFYKNHGCTLTSQFYQFLECGGRH